MSYTCRICTGLATNAKFLFDVDQNHLIYQIELLTGEWLNYEQDWPSFICERCEIDLHIAAAFRERCKQTQQQLNRQVVANAKPDPDPNEFDIKQESDEQNDGESFPHEFSAEPHVPFMEPMGNEPYAEVRNETFIPLTSPTVKQNEQHMEEILQEKLNRFDVCGRCGEHFTNLTNLIYNICKERFRTQSELNRHVSTNNDANRLTCRFCDIEFSKEEEQNEQPNEQRNEPFERPFKREFCESEEEFINQSDPCNSHECPHTRNPKYRCELCDRNFNRFDNFKRHSHSKKHKTKEENQYD